MTEQPSLFFGAGDSPAVILGKYANRHGLITGATGTGKTVTLQVLAEGFSRMGVPVFLADVKGDLSGLAVASDPSKGIQKRVDTLELNDYRHEASPVVFWDLYQKSGHPLRTTISEIGPQLLARMLNLNETQEGVLNVAFSVADEEGLLLLDYKDLHALLNFTGKNRQQISIEYGRVTTASIGAIQRKLLVLKNARGDQLFAEPALSLSDLMRRDENGRGIINLLDARELIQNPRLYSTFLLWLLAELFEDLPEVGDQDTPELVFFFDEAHLLFDDASTSFQDQIERVVRLIRSKGVGIYFVTQNPQDIPDEVLGQLGNRVQHALRAFTPKDQKALRLVAETFVQNPDLDIRDTLTSMGVGEALVSTLIGKGIPSMADHCLICPPRSRMGPIDEATRSAVRANSPISDVYDHTIDRDSAYERLQARAARRAQQEAEDKPPPTSRSGSGSSTRTRSGRARKSEWEKAAGSIARSAAQSFGKSLLRGILGALRGKR